MVHNQKVLPQFYELLDQRQICIFPAGEIILPRTVCLMGMQCTFNLANMKE